MTKSRVFTLLSFTLLSITVYAATSRKCPLQCPNYCAVSSYTALTCITIPRGYENTRPAESWIDVTCDPSNPINILFPDEIDRKMVSCWERLPNPWNDDDWDDDCSGCGTAAGCPPSCAGPY